jgi:DNA-binding IclR family transcriptional regulator
VKKATNPLNRYRVPILDRTLDLMELLSKHPEGLSLAALADQLSMPKNAAYRIATTLMLRGYAERDDAAKSYRLSRRLLGLGHAAIGGESLAQAAGPVLKSLRDVTSETSLLGTLSGTQGIVLDQVVSTHPVKVVVEIGHAFPLHTAAPAKAMLAFLSGEKQDDLIRSITFKKHTKHTITSAKKYRAELMTVRKEGYALDQGEESETYVCAAAPVFGNRGEVIAAIWISGPSDRLPLAMLPAAAKIVKAHAAKLSAAMGLSTAH